MRLRFSQSFWRPANSPKNTNPLDMYYFFVIDLQMSPEILSPVPRMRDPGHVQRLPEVGPEVMPGRGVTRHCKYLLSTG